MSDLTSTITGSQNITSVIASGAVVNASTFSEGGRTLSELTDVDLANVTNGSFLIYNTNEFVARTISGDASVDASGLLTINSNAVSLGTNTTGAYVSTILGTPDQITVLGSGGETANVTLSLPQNISTESSPTFNNITLSGVINNTDLNVKLSLKAPLHNPTFTGTVSGITKSMVGLEFVDNTSDANKPLSSATVAALNSKVDKVVGQGLSDNNYTLLEKNKLAGIAEGAEVNAKADWASTEGDSQILNKPFLGSASASSITDFATALQGEKADTALQPLAFDYRGEYNNGDGTYTYNTVVLWNGLLYKKISNPNNPGYPPSGSDWELFEPEIGSPAFDQWIQTTLDNKVDRVQGQGLSDNNYTLVEKNKLAGIADGATANSSDSYLLNRTNHTGTQSYATITGLGTLATQNGTFSGISSGTNTGDQTITLGGDASGSGTGLVNVTLASTGVVAGKYNDSGSSVTPFTVDVKGRITAVDTPVTLTPSWTNITNKPSTVAGYGISDAVDTFSTQVISGSKSFTTSPTVPLLPTAAGHAASKAYVDTVSEGLHVHAAAHAILTTPLATAIGGGVTINYTNGTDGVNAKLTASAPVTWSIAFADPDITTGSRVIIAGQSTSAHNGIYVVSSATELTRASDFDTPTEMAGGDFVFVTHGTYADTGWVLSEPVTQVGVSPVIFTQFSGAGAYEAGSGLSRDGTTFSVVAGNGISVDGSVSLSTVGSPGTYRSVTVDAYGRVTSGSNPTTLSGYGITDAASSTALSGHISDASVHLTTTQNTLLDGITVTSDKINYLSDVSSNIQLQLDGKSATTHGHSDATTSVSGFLSSSDKTKLDGIAAGAEVNVNADWNATTGDAAIFNKPSTFPPSSHTHTDATTSVSGFLSPTDKVKLDNIPAGVNYGVVTNAFPSGFGSGIANINWQAGTYWSGYLGLVGGTLIQFQNVVAGKIITLSITGSGSPVSWPTGITWLGGSAPTLANGQTRIIKILATSTSTFVASVDTKLNSSASYLDLVDVPTSFTPAVHSHDVVGTQSYTAGFMSYSDKVKLDGIESGAEVNVNADWAATTGDAAILNKPTTLAGYGITDAAAFNHTHSTSQITNLYQPTPEQDPDATSAMTYNGYKLNLVGPQQYLYVDGGVYYACSYNSNISRWEINDSESTFLTSTNNGLYPWLATWPGGASIAKYSYPRVAGAALAATASDGISNYAARADHVHPLPTALQIGAAPLVGGKVPVEYMPSATDDVLVFENRGAFPVIGESGKIYLAQFGRRYNGVWHEGGRMYYWSNSSSYIEIAPLSVYNPSDASALVVWSDSPNNIFIPTGVTNDRPNYTLFEGSVFTQTHMAYDTGRWIIYSIGEEYSIDAQASPGTEAYPWLANWGTSNYITRLGSYSSDITIIPRKGAAIGSSGTSGRSAREDHVHPLPTPDEIGASSKNFAIAMAVALG